MIDAVCKRKADKREFRIRGQVTTHEGERWVLVPEDHGPVIDVSARELRKDFSKLRLPSGATDDVEAPAHGSEAAGWAALRDTHWLANVRSLLRFDQAPTPEQTFDGSGPPDARAWARQIFEDSEALAAYELAFTNYHPVVNRELDRLIAQRNRLNPSPPPPANA